MRQNPGEYVRRITSMLPKEVTVDHNPARELDDAELDNLIQAMRQRVIEAVLGERRHRRLACRRVAVG